MRPNIARSAPCPVWGPKKVSVYVAPSVKQATRPSTSCVLNAVSNRRTMLIAIDRGESGHHVALHRADVAAHRGHLALHRSDGAAQGLEVLARLGIHLDDFI